MICAELTTRLGHLVRLVRVGVSTVSGKSFCMSSGS